MKSYLLSFFLFAILSISFSSCSKEGCTDADAENFCEDCKKDDRSCVYKGSVVFWFKQSVATNLVNDGAVTLYYYVNASLIGSSAANVYWTAMPDCDASGAVSMKYDLGTSKSQVLSYQVKDQTGHVYWNGSVQFSAGKCTGYELIW